MERMRAAGALIYARTTNRFLFLLRNNTRTRNTWGLPGGKLLEEETIIDGLNRELIEELGIIPEIIKYLPVEVFTSVDQEFQYYSYVFVIENEFLPILNDEHDGYAWATLEKFPRPLHPELYNTISISELRKKIQLIMETFRVIS